jgi:hypothetical protein
MLDSLADLSMRLKAIWLAQFNECLHRASREEGETRAKYLRLAEEALAHLDTNLPRPGVKIAAVLAGQTDRLI